MVIQLVGEIFIQKFKRSTVSTKLITGAAVIGDKLIRLDSSSFAIYYQRRILHDEIMQVMLKINRGNIFSAIVI